MSTSPLLKKSAYLIVTAVLIMASWSIGLRAHYLLGVYRKYKAVEHVLPNLPPIRAATRQRDTRFPRVWLHRVDAVERAVLMAPHYQGMEIDVVYHADADLFDVGHPPLPSAGISLDSLFASIPRIRDHFFWIDFKNLTDSNQKAACHRLVTTGRKYQIVNQMIVESPNPEALACFTENGFYTSYCLFPEFRLADLGPQQLVAYYEEIKTHLAVSQVDALSSSYRSLPFMEKYFPDADMLVWYNEPRRSLRYYASLAYLRLRPTVKVVLVHQWSRGYR